MQQQQQQAPYFAPGSQYGQPQAAPVTQLGQQFGQMNLQGGQRPVCIGNIHQYDWCSRILQIANMPINLIGMPMDPNELSAPLPDIHLPPNVCLSQTSEGNAHPSYMRSTINAIPTTHSLLNKSKLPFALVLTPHRSLQEGDVSCILKEAFDIISLFNQ